MTKVEKSLLIVNATLFAIITIFSYAYVDLNLTLGQNQKFLDFVSSMQHLGYFSRPLATLIFASLMFAVFAMFAMTLFLFFQKKVGSTFLKVSTVINTAILIFAYPFLSADLFNYLFDAKIILNYHANPYSHRPLDFPGDEWLRFMRWTHRYSPYGPLWLGASILPAALGFGKLTLNLLAFKLFIGAFHLVNTFLIIKILNIINRKYSLIGAAFYSLNPVLLLEGVANSHNDIILATFLLLPVYFLALNRPFLAYASLAAGTLIKYIPLLTLPWLIREKFSKSKKITRFILFNLATMVIFTFIFSSFRITVPFVSSGATQTQFQGWYLFWTLPLVAVASSIELIIIGTAVSIGAVIRYFPYLYTGEWTQPGTISFMQSAIILSIIIGLLIVISKRFIFK